MAYRLKTIKYKNRECSILLQNENGPCPLLAAANALLLRGSIELPPHCRRNQVASLDDLTNTLVNQALSTDSYDAHYIDELMQHIPTFQHGMDVNPKFTQGVHGYENTSALTALDMLHVALVHGWLVDPHDEAETAAALGTKTYNEVIELVIHGNEAAMELETLHGEIERLEAAQPAAASSSSSPASLAESWDMLDDEGHRQQAVHHQRQLSELREQQSKLQDVAMQGSLIHHFLENSSHQLTIYGLHALYEQLQVGELCIFFRNNHYNTLTKYEDGLLYLLVTDYGYANTPGIVWEKLDVIDGDTEYVDASFAPPKGGGNNTAPQTLQQPAETLTAEQLLAQAGRNDADYQAAIALSLQEQQQQNTSSAPHRIHDGGGGDDNEFDAALKAATDASLQDYQQHQEIQQSMAQAAPAPSYDDIVNAHGGPAPLSPVPPPPPPPPAATSNSAFQEESDHYLAVQLAQHDAAAGTNNTDEDAVSLALARRLQKEENQRAAAAPPRRTTTTTTRTTTTPRPATTARPPTTRPSSQDSGCRIS